MKFLLTAGSDTGEPLSDARVETDDRCRQLIDGGDQREADGSHNQCVLDKVLTLLITNDAPQEHHHLSLHFNYTPSLTTANALRSGHLFRFGLILRAEQHVTHRSEEPVHWRNRIAVGGKIHSPALKLCDQVKVGESCQMIFLLS